MQYINDCISTFVGVNCTDMQMAVVYEIYDKLRCLHYCTCTHINFLCTDQNCLIYYATTVITQCLVHFYIYKVHPLSISSRFRHTFLRFTRLLDHSELGSSTFCKSTGQNLFPMSWGLQILHCCAPYMHIQHFEPGPVSAVFLGLVYQYEP